MNYKVIYPVDSLDSNPTIKIFNEEYEALEWLENEVQHRIDHIVQHSPFTISEEEYQQIEESEYSLVQIQQKLY